MSAVGHSIIGIDLGTHSASIAVWHEDKDMMEVLADDLGFRTIPCAVAFRGEETIVGHSAISQQHKNASNTFVEVRSMLLDKEKEHVEVPLLEKQVSVEEINSLFFRNIHNQVKQQAGKVIREAVVTVPQPLCEDTKRRYIGAAQAGGIRIKSFIEDSTAALLAYGQDQSGTNTSKTLVLDLGWSRCTASLYHVSGGMFVPLGQVSTTNTTGSIFVKLLAEFCAKDFTRKYKVPINDNKRAMLRLHRECENAMKTLSTGQEATIDLDSLAEGFDYSSKVSRARFEDLLSIPIVHFKNLINEALAKASLEAGAVTQVLLSGGPAAMPRIINTLKALLPKAVFPKVRFETYEAACLGACVHGKQLHQMGLLDHAPTHSPKATAFNRSVFITANPNGGDQIELIPANSVLPARAELAVSLPAAEASLYLLLGPAVAADPIVPLGELVVKIEDGQDHLNTNLSLVIVITGDNGISAEVIDLANKNVVSSLTVPF